MYAYNWAKATMYKLVVLFAVLGVVFSKPGYLHGGSYHLPSAVSTSSRVDVHGPSIPITVPAAPSLNTPNVIENQYIPTAYNPVELGHLTPFHLPSAVSHQSRYDVHHPGHQLVHTVHTVPRYVTPNVHGYSHY